MGMAAGVAKLSLGVAVRVDVVVMLMSMMPMSVALWKIVVPMVVAKMVITMMCNAMFVFVGRVRTTMAVVMCRPSGRQRSQLPEYEPAQLARSNHASVLTISGRVPCNASTIIENTMIADSAWTSDDKNAS
jgi:hypothetical protein